MPRVSPIVRVLRNVPVLRHQGGSDDEESTAGRHQPVPGSGQRTERVRQRRPPDGGNAEKPVRLPRRRKHAHPHRRPRHHEGDPRRARLAHRGGLPGRLPRLPLLRPRLPGARQEWRRDDRPARRDPLPVRPRLGSPAHRRRPRRRLRRRPAGGPPHRHPRLLPLRHRPARLRPLRQPPSSSAPANLTTPASPDFSAPAASLRPTPPTGTASSRTRARRIPPRSAPAAPPAGSASASRRTNAVLIAACRDDQTSADAWIDGGYHGAHTYYLCRALANGARDLTCRALVSATGTALSRAGFDQVPQLEGPARLLGGIRRSDLLPLAVNSGFDIVYTHNPAYAPFQ